MGGFNRKVSSTGSIEVPVGIRAESYDPSLMSRPAFIRETVHLGSVQTEGGLGVNARLKLNGGVVSRATKEFEVADNDFSTGWVDLFVGDYHLISGIDFQIGANAGATATNIAAAINYLTGFSAVAAGSDVTISSDSPTNRIEFRIHHRGTVTNFVPATATEFFDVGSPRIGA